MFTISHHDEGTEHFIAAEAVVYHGPFSPRYAEHGQPFLEVVQPDKTFDVSRGQAYVMNEQGATVGRYDLSIPVADKPKQVA